MPGIISTNTSKGATTICVINNTILITKPESILLSGFSSLAYCSAGYVTNMCSASPVAIANIRYAEINPILERHDYVLVLLEKIHDTLLWARQFSETWE